MDRQVAARERTRTIEQMFSRLVPHYDRMNRLMTGGRDGRWRTLAVQASQPQGAVVLDLGAGTGDLSAEFRRQGAGRVLGFDVSATMLGRAEQKFGAIASTGCREMRCIFPSPINHSMSSPRRS